MEAVRQQLDEIWAKIKEIGARFEPSAIESQLNQAALLLENTDHMFDLDRAKLTRHRARVHFLRQEYEEGIRMGEHALDLYESLDEDLDRARTIMMIGNCYNHAGKYQESIRYHSQAVEMLQVINDKEELSWGLINLGVSYLGLGEYERALSSTERAIETATELGDAHILSHAYTMMATPYFYMGDYSSSMKYALRSFELSKRSDMLYSAAMSASNISYIAFQVGALSLAQTWSKISEELRTKIETTTHHVNDDLNRLMIDLKLDPSLEAALEFERILAQYQEDGHGREAVQSVPFLADIYLELGDRVSAERVVRTWFDLTREAEFKPGILTLRRVRLGLNAHDSHNENLVVEGEAILAEAQDSKVSEEVEESLRLLAQLHRDRGEHDRSVEYYERYIDVRAKNVEFRSLHTTQMAQIQFDHERLDELSDKQQDLLSSVMPEEIVERLMNGEENIADAFDDASVMFLDLVSFTDLSSSVPPTHLIHLLNAVFSTCDDVVNEHGLTKIKTIGDSYLAVSGLPHQQDDHAQRMANAALDLMARLKDLQVTMPPELGDTSWVNNVDDLSIRIGLHCGPVVAGVIGRHRAQYDVWGDTVNTASRMESSGEPDHIHISEDFAMKLAQGASPEFEGTDVVIRQAPFLMRLRGTQKIKGKGDMKTFWLEGA